MRLLAFAIGLRAIACRPAAKPVQCAVDTIERLRMIGVHLLALSAVASHALAADVRPVGLTQSGSRINASIVKAPAGAPTVVLIGGLAGEDESSGVVKQEIRWFEGQSRHRFHLIAIPIANPQKSKLVFPPTGAAYRDNPESHYLWRWIALQAP